MKVVMVMLGTLYRLHVRDLGLVERGRTLYNVDVGNVLGF